MSVLLHLGAHDTGTRVLERLLEHNRERLRAAGIGVLLQGAVEQTLLEALVKLEAARNVGRIRKEVHGVLQHLGTPHVIISHPELLGSRHLDRAGGLYPEARERADALRRILEAMNGQVVLHVSHQPRFIAQCYEASVRAGRWCDFESYLSPIDFCQLDWQRPVAALTAAFPGRVTLRCHEALELRGASAMFRDFMTVANAHFGMGAETLDQLVVDVNPDSLAYSGKALHVARAAWPRMKPAERPRLGAFLEKHFSAARYKSPDPTQGFVRDALLAHYGSTNRELLEAHGLSEFLPFYEQDT